MTTRRQRTMLTPLARVLTVLLAAALGSACAPQGAGAEPAGTPAGTESAGAAVIDPVAPGPDEAIERALAAPTGSVERWLRIDESEIALTVSARFEWDADGATRETLVEAGGPAVETPVAEALVDAARLAYGTNVEILDAVGRDEALVEIAASLRELAARPDAFVEIDGAGVAVDVRWSSRTDTGTSSDQWTFN